QLESEIEWRREIQKGGRMEHRRRHLPEEGHAALGQRVPEREMPRPELLRDEELHRVIQTARIAVIELHRRVERRREEKAQQDEAEERGSCPAESVARRHVGPT